jgi:hypothetical protein
MLQRSADHVRSTDMSSQPSNARPWQPDGAQHRLQCLFLDRLHRLIDLDESWNAEWSTEERRLLEHALYSTYHDCVRVGLRPIARAMLTLDSAGEVPSSTARTNRVSTRPD